MAECNTCGGYLSIEDKIRLSMKCDANGNVVWQGALLNQSLEATLTSTGTGAGVSTLRMEVSEDQTFEITSGTARFYTDAAGTLGESTTWNVTAGALRTIYLKAPSGSSKMLIPNPENVIYWGGPTDGWASSNNAAIIDVSITQLINLSTIRISGNSVITGTLPFSLTILRLGAGVTWVSSQSLPDLTNYIILSGNNIDWTGLSIGSGSNITTFTLQNYRVSKMSSADMITLLTQMTNRAGTLPETIIINDYADYASPPAEVVTAVDALKTAKSITTVTLGA